MYKIPETLDVQGFFFANDIVVYSAHKDLTFAAHRTQCAINQTKPNTVLQKIKGSVTEASPADSDSWRLTKQESAGRLLGQFVCARFFS